MVVKIGMTLLTSGDHILGYVFAATSTRFDMMKAVSIFSACLARDTRLVGFIIHF